MKVYAFCVFFYGLGYCIYEEEGKSYPQWVMPYESDLELLPGYESMRGKCWLLFWLVKAFGLLEEVDSDVLGLGVGHD